MSRPQLTIQQIIDLATDMMVYRGTRKAFAEENDIDVCTARKLYILTIDIKLRDKKILEAAYKRRRITKKMYEVGLIAIDEVHTRDICELPVSELCLSTRAYNCLTTSRGNHKGIQTIGELLEMDMMAFAKIPHFGRKSFDNVIDKVHAAGLKMHWERDILNSGLKGETA